MGALSGDSLDPNVPGVKGTNAGGKIAGLDIVGGWGVEGVMGTDPSVFSDQLFGGGVLGVSNSGFGVAGASSASVGVSGFASGGGGPFAKLIGVEGQIIPSGLSGIGVQGTGGSDGVVGIGNDFGVRGGILGPASGFLGGKDPIFNQHAGVFGQSDQTGVFGNSDADTGTGVMGRGGAGPQCFGVRGETTAGTAVQGHSFGSGLAGKFIGNVEVTGNLNMSSPTSDIVMGDVAEGFSTLDSEIIEPGTVVVLSQDGFVRPGDEAYDKKVAGVVSGAGDYRPAIVLDQRSSQASRLPVAMMGKVCCKVDAVYGPVEVGDLLTTSPTRGHAMKATDHSKAFGAVIGKALGSLPAGQGLIPVLVALQ